MTVKNATESQFLHTLKKEVDNSLPHLSGLGKIVIESAALTQITAASLKVAPYAYLSNELGIGGLANFFNSRGTYLEATLMSVASLVYQVVMLAFYTVFMVGTLGTSDLINDNCKKHWVHLVYAAASVGIGTVGVLRPYWGTLLNAGLIYYSTQILRRAYYADLNKNEQLFIKKIRKLYNENFEVILKIFQARWPEHRYQHEFKPSLEYIHRKLDHIKNIDEFNNLLQDIWLRFPHMGLTNQ